MSFFGIGESSQVDLAPFGLDNAIDAKSAEKEFDTAIKAAEISGHNQSEKELALNKAKALIGFLDRDADKGKSWIRVAKLEPTQEGMQAALNTARPFFMSSSSSCDFDYLKDMALMEQRMKSDITATVCMMERVAEASVKSTTGGLFIMIDRLEGSVGCWLALVEFTAVPEKKLEYLKHAKEAYNRINPSTSTIGFLFAVAEMEKEIDPVVGKKTEENAQIQAKSVGRKLSKK